MIKIIDCGSQLTQNIARRIRELGVYTEIVPYHAPKENILTGDLEGIIISGGQFSVYDKGSPLCQKEILNANIPILGICYGQQSIAHLLEGRVASTEKREYGRTRVRIVKESPLFREIADKEIDVWMSHGDIVEVLPPGIETVALSQNNHIAAMQNCEKGIYAVQFHPEVDHTQHGRKILNNFIDICNAQRTWDPEKEYDRIVAYLEEKVKGKIGVGGISGGVDSSAASVLLSKIAGRDYHPIFVDNGLLRLNEAEEVRRSLEPFELNITYVDAGERFLSKLKGVVDPDEKRKIIGNEFIAVFEEEAGKISGVTYLLQGTLYPDVIESVPIYGSSSKIKRHHNVGGLPEKMGLKVVEPFNRLFKDEVRKIAEDKLKMPKEIVWRQPFPGPGLAVRIIGEITPGKLSIVRRADAIFIEELKKRDLYYKISQAFAVLTDTKSVGVMGDAGTYQANIGLRAVVTKDYMTADIYHFDWNDLQAITNRIINEVKGINNVAYYLGQKPPATIELE
ncbi:glutamine-hydrolyzing GMP synthase [Candidatus Woesearchaeota archaeon]|nr:glutamine-hydrolyzing GMP synthase [Candidatus Woesearchaeota archaeon]